MPIKSRNALMDAYRAKMSESQLARLYALVISNLCNVSKAL